MSNKLILLFNPQPRCYKDEQANAGYKIPPMSLLAIAAPLDKAGYQVRIVDASVDADYENKIKSFAPNTICLGITSFTGYQIYGGLAISKSLKSTYPQIPIIWGGYHPTILPEQTVANEYVDIVVRGQGEKTFFELVKALDEGLSLDNVSGITFKKNGVIINNPDRVIENINNFPCTPYHLIDVEKYIFDSIGTRTIGYRTSQGCPYSCKFCAEPMVTKGEWSGLYATRVADEIEYLVKKYNVNAVLIFDPNFFVDKERVRDICKGIINKRLNIHLGNLNGRAEQLLKFDDQIWRLLKQAGCTDIMIGAESGSEEILRHINKGASVEDTIEVKRLLSKYDITVYISLIFGLPSDEKARFSPRQELEYLLDLLNKIYRIDDNNMIDIFNYTPYPGTSLFDLAVKNGIHIPDNLQGWISYTLNNNNIPWIRKRYARIITFLNKFILPYNSRYLSHNWLNHTNILKRFLYKVLHMLAVWRLEYRIFIFPFEYYISRLVAHHRSKTRNFI